jgi:hypothetical protein
MSFYREFERVLGKKTINNCFKFFALKKQIFDEKSKKMRSQTKNRSKSSIILVVFMLISIILLTITLFPHSLAYQSKPRFLRNSLLKEKREEFQPPKSPIESTSAKRNLFAKQFLAGLVFEGALYIGIENKKTPFIE